MLLFTPFSATRCAMHRNGKKMPFRAASLGIFTQKKRENTSRDGACEQ